MAAYTDYSISQSKLELLRSQERSVKRQIKKYKENLKQLEKVRTFMSQIENLELKKDQWDLFFVDLKDHPISFEKLQAILAQTHNSSHYFFKPSKLSIKTGAHIPDTAILESKKNNTAQSNTTIQSVRFKKEIPSQVDVTINLDGRFLVKRRGAG